MITGVSADSGLTSDITSDSGYFSSFDTVVSVKLSFTVSWETEWVTTVAISSVPSSAISGVCSDILTTGPLSVVSDESAGENSSAMLSLVIGLLDSSSWTVSSVSSEIEDALVDSAFSEGPTGDTG